MAGEAVPQVRPVVTLVLRLWPAGPAHRPGPVRYQATHVQSGEVAYFQTLECLAQHIERLAEHVLLRSTSRPPIDFPQRRAELSAKPTENPHA